MKASPSAPHFFLSLAARAVAAVSVASLFLLSSGARAEDGGSGGTGATGDGGAGESVEGCVETVPSGRPRPVVTDSFPARGTSGYAATLSVTIDHLAGETVLPSGLSLTATGDLAKLLKQAGFALPDQDAGAAAKLEVLPPDPKKPDKLSTKITLPVVALPEGPGRHALSLPPLPLAVARASGEVMTTCTHRHAIVVDDPTASTPEAMPKPNPNPRPQREEWTALKDALEWVAVGLALGTIVAVLAYRFAKRPKPVPPPPPPRPPWEVAIERLDEIRHAGLLTSDRHAEFFDRVNDTLRAYLGARYGYEGLESTTDETVASLKKSGAGAVLGYAVPGGLDTVIQFLGTCDLVKFAKMDPSLAECEKALEVAERVVRGTMPRAPGAPPPSAGPAPKSPPGDAPSFPGAAP